MVCLGAFVISSHCPTRRHFQRMPLLALAYESQTCRSLCSISILQKKINYLNLWLFAIPCGSHFCCWQREFIFGHLLLVDDWMLWAMRRLMTVVQGHPRSLISLQSDSACATFRLWTTYSNAVPILCIFREAQVTLPPSASDSTFDYWRYINIWLTLTLTPLFWPLYY